MSITGELRVPGSPTRRVLTGVATLVLGSALLFGVGAAADHFESTADATDSHNEIRAEVRAVETGVAATSARLNTHVETDRIQQTNTDRLLNRIENLLNAMDMRQRRIEQRLGRRRR